MFEEYPKTRPPLPEEITKIYEEHYKSNREGQTTASFFAQKMESWLHRQVASDVANTSGAGVSTLELGAGTLNQLQHEPEMEAYDIVEPFAELFESSPLLPKIRTVYADISEVPKTNKYDRITSVATLEHVTNLPQLVANSGLLLNDSGVFRASIPNEGTFLWTLGWKLTTGIEFRLRHGQDYGRLMRYEHVNTAADIERVLTYFFDDVQCKVFGLSKQIAFYRYYSCSNPKQDRCEEFNRI